jgi:ribosomal protein L33
MAEPATPEVKSTSLVCEECARVWVTAAERWRLYLTDDNPRQAVPYCPRCAAEQFG